MADVSGNLKDWSTTAASNSPAGSTVIGTGLDDNLRELQKVVRQDLAALGSDIASAATTDLGAVAGLMHTITGTTTITSFGTVSAGIWKILRFGSALTLTHNATTLILPGATNITTAADDVLIAISLGSGNWRVLAYQPSANSPNLTPTIQVFTSSGTYTKPAGLRKARVRVVGGGGGSGGTAATGVGQRAASGGGGGGGYAEELLTAASIGATETVTIGAGGTAGATGNNAGGAGGTTSFGALLSATGGAGGTGSGAGAIGVNNSVAGGIGSGGDINAAGGCSNPGIVISDGASVSNNAGKGGDSVLGGGGNGAGTDGVGSVGRNYGGGAGGSASVASQAAKAGAAGAAGIVIVEEFYS